MTQDEIYEMVKESDLGFLLGDNWMMHHELETFAKLVAAKATASEREACAKVVEDSLWFTRLVVAKAIRARGEQA
jgi:hypothetical protein